MTGTLSIAIMEKNVDGKKPSLRKLKDSEIKHEENENHVIKQIVQ